MRFLFAVFLAFAATTVRADTDSDGVTQVKQSFVPDRLEVAAGTTVVFANADDVNHNLQAVAPDGDSQDYGLEKPGETTSITFAKPGVYTVKCAIHPRMKAHVTVK